MRPKKELGDEHKAINALLVELGNSVDGADWVTIQHAFREVERQLKGHFELEEQHLFNELEARHPKQIQQLRDEHEGFLSTLEALAVESEIHTLRKERVDDFVSQLQRHSQREDDSLYQWADELPELSQRPLLAYFDRVRSRLASMQ